MSFFLLEFDRAVFRFRNNEVLQRQIINRCVQSTQWLEGEKTHLSNIDVYSVRSLKTIT